MIKYLACLILVCKIFSFYDNCGEQHTQIAINEWVKNKRIVSQTQTINTVPYFGEGFRTTTTITIIAEVI